MTPAEYRVISIGTLAAHPLWDEKADLRTGHATTTLVTTGGAGGANILINPSLPPRVLSARMSERTKIKPEEITHVFVTTFSHDHYRGLSLFTNAEWLLHEPERMCAEAAINDQLERAREGRDGELIRTVEGHLVLLTRCKIARDNIAPGVDIFPLPGLSPGTCGLLLALPASTVLICGDAVATLEHLEQGKVLPHCMDIDQAQESFKEAIEIADALILGRDNITYNPLRRLM